MRYASLHIASTAIFILLLVGVYVADIAGSWSYRGFTPLRPPIYIFVALVIACVYSLALSKSKDFRNLTQIMMHYIFFVPGLLISITEGVGAYYPALHILTYTVIIVFSRIPTGSPNSLNFNESQFFQFAFLTLVISVFFLILYGGLERFSLNPFNVYNFRKDAAEAMPNILAYFYFGVSKIIAPMTLVWTIYSRKYLYAITVVFLIILMFGMTHHKTIVFLPFAVGVLYLLIKSERAVMYILLAFNILVFLSLVEILFLIFMESENLANYTSIIIRRIFLVPPLTDAAYINYFYDSPKIFWSTSKFGLGIFENPYDLSAPNLIGRDVFRDTEISANAGIIGSGFSHAGLIGVALYSAFFGLMISVLNSFGEKIGHRMVFVTSISIVISILTTTDFTTAILTHGLLLLFLLLLIFPRQRILAHKYVKVSP